MSTRFDISQTPLDGLVSLQRKPVRDARGFLERVYCASDLAALLGDRRIVQANHTLTLHKGAVRGLHFQYTPHAETKIVSCLSGSIFDVAVDVRRDSPTFLRWHGVILSEENHVSLVVPEGFAHGFQALTDNAEIIYMTTAPYNQAAEGAIHPHDPSIGIHWPLPISQMSERDSSHPMIDPLLFGVSS